MFFPGKDRTESNFYDWFIIYDKYGIHINSFLCFYILKRNPCGQCSASVTLKCRLSHHLDDFQFSIRIPGQSSAVSGHLHWKLRFFAILVGRKCSRSYFKTFPIICKLYHYISISSFDSIFVLNIVL